MFGIGSPHRQYKSTTRAAHFSMRYFLGVLLQFWRHAKFCLNRYRRYSPHSLQLSIYGHETVQSISYCMFYIQVVYIPDTIFAVF
jgi:hypothetical protein